MQVETVVHIATLKYTHTEIHPRYIDAIFTLINGHLMRIETVVHIATPKYTRTEIHPR